MGPPDGSIYASGDTLFSFINGEAAHYSYQWYDACDSLTGATDSFYVATTAGCYRLQITDSNGCSRIFNPSECFCTLGLEKYNEKNNVSVFPNPVAKGSFIQLSLNEGVIVREISIYNIVGEKNYDSKINSASMLKPIEIELNAGIYFIQIKTDNAIDTRKIVVQQK